MNSSFLTLVLQDNIFLEQFGVIAEWNFQEGNKDIWKTVKEIGKIQLFQILPFLHVSSHLIPQNIEEIEKQ